MLHPRYWIAGHCDDSRYDGYDPRTYVGVWIEVLLQVKHVQRPWIFTHEVVLV